ncbi:hypothetical protein KKF25_02560 [Patescibacteria group bacterium]|nr:hypothetical protein [Patescibacteria group bacterium]
MIKCHRSNIRTSDVLRLNTTLGQPEKSQAKITKKITKVLKNFIHNFAIDMVFWG